MLAIHFYPVVNDLFVMLGLAVLFVSVFNNVMIYSEFTLTSVLEEHDVLEIGAESCRWHASSQKRRLVLIMLTPPHRLLEV